MLSQLNQIEATALASLETATDEPSLEQWRITFLGRSSPLMGVFDMLGTLPKEERPLIGRRANEVKRRLESALGQRAEGLRQAALDRSLQAERLDVTLPGRPVPHGRLHPATQTLRQVYHIFAEMGFQIYRSREVETDEYNFQLLNFPPNHPARDMWNTFFVDTGTERGDNPVLLRPHTSPGQIRAMREYAAQDLLNPPPVRIILPGMCYRYEQISARYEIQFNQVEGLAIGSHITLGDLQGTINDLAHRLFGPQIHTRFRASHFPFTEPSAEVDFECFLCGGRGWSVCKYTGWLEILGCGMVHPNVLRNGGYDPQRYSGFAFGIGTERITMLVHHIEDIRYFWANDMRFLEQF